MKISKSSKVVGAAKYEDFPSLVTGSRKYINIKHSQTPRSGPMCSYIFFDNFLDRQRDTTGDLGDKLILPIFNIFEMEIKKNFIFRTSNLGRD